MSKFYGQVNCDLKGAKADGCFVDEVLLYAVIFAAEKNMQDIKQASDDNDTGFGHREDWENEIVVCKKRRKYLDMNRLSNCLVRRDA